MARHEAGEKGKKLASRKVSFSAVCRKLGLGLFDSVTGAIVMCPNLAEVPSVPEALERPPDCGDDAQCAGDEGASVEHLNHPDETR